VAAEETPSNSELTDALYAANDVLSSWNPEILPVLPLKAELFNLTGTLTYTMGPGGTFNTTRSVKIESVAVTANGAQRACRLVTVEEWASIPDITRTGLFADMCIVNNGYPLMTVNFWPTPASGGLAVIYSYKPLAGFASLTDTVDLAPGYTRALRWALAFEMAPEFGRTVTQEMATLAANSKAQITGLNQAVLGKPSTVEPADPSVPPVQAPVRV